jgi:hypothetical protein
MKLNLTKTGTVFFGIKLKESTTEILPNPATVNVSFDTELFNNILPER